MEHRLTDLSKTNVLLNFICFFISVKQNGKEKKKHRRKTQIRAEQMQQNVVVCKSLGTPGYA